MSTPKTTAPHKGRPEADLTAMMMIKVYRDRVWLIISSDYGNDPGDREKRFSYTFRRPHDKSEPECISRAWSVLTEHLGSATSEVTEDNLPGW